MSGHELWLRAVGRRKFYMKTIYLILMARGILGRCRSLGIYLPPLPLAAVGSSWRGNPAEPSVYLTLGKCLGVCRIATDAAYRTRVQDLGQDFTWVAGMKQTANTGQWLTQAAGMS